MKDTTTMTVNNKNDSMIKNNNDWISLTEH